MRSGAAGLAGFRLLGLDPHKIKVVVMREDTGEDVTLSTPARALGVPSVLADTASDYQAVVYGDQLGQASGDRLPALKFARNSETALADMLTAVGPDPGGAPRLETCDLIAGDDVWNPKSLPGA